MPFLRTLIIIIDLSKMFYWTIRLRARVSIARLFMEIENEWFNCFGIKLLVVHNLTTRKAHVFIDSQ